MARATLLLAAVKFSLWVLPFRTAVSFWDPPEPSEPKTDAAFMSLVSHLVPRIARRMMKDRPCLVQALTARYLIKRRGNQAVFRIGVAKGDDAELRAHAWVECDNRIVIGGVNAPDVYAALERPDNARP